MAYLSEETLAWGRWEGRPCLGGVRAGGKRHLLIFVVIWFLLIRPRQKAEQQREQETRDFRSSLKNGDRVITAGGIYGIVTSVRDDTVQLRIADAVKIEVLRSAISSRQPEAGLPCDEIIARIKHL